MLKAIAKPFGMLLMWLYEFVGNYGLALILFALIIKVILLPFQIKSKKSTLKTARLQPQMEELKKKHGANQQKYNEEVQKLYQEEGINPMSGCLWTMLPFPILLALYYAIRYPITIMMGVAESALEAGGALIEKLTSLGFTSTMSEAYVQIEQAQFISENFSKFTDLGLEKLSQIDFTFLGMNLGQMPSFKVWEFDFSNTAVGMTQVGLFLIPVLAGVLTFLSSKISMKLNPAGNAGSMKTMNLIMPLITLWFGFIMPAAVGLYWLANMLFGVVQDIILNKTLGKAVAKEAAERAEARRKREEELEAKRRETERLRAQNATMQNKNTSKRKQQMQERKEKDQKTAEWEKTHVKRGGKIIEIDPNEGKNLEPSRVGDRKYARGRAYDPDRFKNGKTIKSAPAAVEETAEEPAVVIEETDLIEENVLPAEEVLEAQAEEAEEFEEEYEEEFEAEEAEEAEEE